MNKHIIESVFATCGGLLALLQPTLPLLTCCTFAVIVDCLSAVLLGRRAHKAFPTVCSGKPSSCKMKQIFSTLLNIYSVILLCYLVDTYCVTFANINLAQICAGVFCMIQILSILENISSCNDARWANILQKILIDKTSRHLDVDITDALKNDKKKCTKRKCNE